MRKLTIGIPIPSPNCINGGGYYLQIAIIDEIIAQQQSLFKHYEILFIAQSHVHAQLFLKSKSSVKSDQVFTLEKSWLEYSLHWLDIFFIRPFKRLISSSLSPNYSTRNVDRKLKSKINILWNLNPTSISTEVPFVLPVWDLQHRLQPFFPEVSENGAWKIREEWYSTQIPRATLLVTGTKRGANEICNFYGVDATKFLINPLPIILPKVKVSGEFVSNIIDAFKLSTPYIVYPANYWPHKNHLHLLLALHSLIQRGIPLHLVLIGEKQGTWKAIVKLARQLEISKNIHYINKVNSKSLIAIYKGSKGLCYPSFFGPDNLPPIEALYLGIPAAVADVPGAREQLKDQVLYFNPCIPEEIACAIESMLGYDDNMVNSPIPAPRIHLNTVNNYVTNILRRIHDISPYIRSAQLDMLIDD